MAKRTNYEILNDLDKSGELKQLSKSGFLPCNICTHVEFYRYFKSLKHTGGKTTKIIIEASDRFKICESYAYKIIRGLEK